ncbi:MAG: OmpA family protein [Deltaproteobacteria bacterium]|nr:OmpA family protein [Deltaproteobacteria bacterium]
MNEHDTSSKPDDPFQTIIRPSPGGRRSDAGAGVQEQSKAPGPSSFDLRAVDIGVSNPLVHNAFSMLSLVPKLRMLPFHNAISELRERLVSELREFENRVLQEGGSREQARIATYYICSLIDQTVLNTPWGNQSDWGHHSLLYRLHNEAWGGERFFLILDRLLQRPAQNLNLLELAYLCLSLGFEGKYRTMGNGMRALEQLRQELYLQIQRARGDPQDELSIRWQGLRDLRNPLMRYVPLWVLTAIAAFLLLIIYGGFVYMLNRASDNLYNRLVAMAGQVVKTPLPPIKTRPIPPPPNPPGNIFETLLAPEIQKKMVAVMEGPVLRILNAFPSGKDEIREEFRPMLVKIAQQLQNDTTRIQVIGHTDNRPIKFSARFSSNYDLSIARAKNVAGILAASAPIGERIGFAGRGESQPLVDNDTQENQALNRRIEIFIR